MGRPSQQHWIVYIPQLTHITQPTTQLYLVYVHFFDEYSPHRRLAWVTLICQLLFAGFLYAAAELHLGRALREEVRNMPRSVNVPEVGLSPYASECTARFYPLWHLLGWRNATDAAEQT